MGFLSLMENALGDVNERGLNGMDEGEYEDRAIEAIPADVYMFSGCMDNQTSADVGNVQSFGLPPDSGPGGAGGACTNALLATSYRPGEETWVQLLTQMRDFLSSRGYSQIPQLSTSRKVDLQAPFEIAGGYGGCKKSLLVGINYVNHSSGRLSGCINDVVSMVEFLESTEGFSQDPDSMLVLVDDHNDHNLRHRVHCPLGDASRDGIIDGIRWLVDGAQAGDCLFFHYSGHGGQKRDYSGEEEDGKDETLIPEDYRNAGVIKDDELFEILVQALPMGVRLVCLMDCCHSGTVLDLPFTFAATENNLVAASEGGGMAANPGFKGTVQKILKHVGGADAILGIASKFGLW
eukprot:TRINITY_DN5839_c0_g2_i2.p2 TRINITY_DN5839_c0_g2~~TRINITY_DN5839_c0_g2_i2.p2  ORF type:complete len:349 (+),score=151.81 TRINITY_DN5839_c0_g2_i2:54-1100(+)